MSQFRRPTRLSRHHLLVFAVSLLAGWSQASVVRGDMISAITGKSTVDPLDPQYLLTPLYVSFSIGGGTIPMVNFSLTNVAPTPFPDQSLTFTQDRAFTAGLQAVARYGYGSVFNVLMGTFRQSLTSIANPPSTIPGSVTLSVNYYNSSSTYSVAHYNLQVWAVPEPSSIVSGTIAVLGFGGLAMRRRGLRKAA